MIKLTSRELFKVLSVLVGETVPVADSAVDDRVKENLETLIDIGNWVLSEMSNTARHRKDIYNSSKVVGELAYSTMLEWKSWLEKIEGELA